MPRLVHFEIHATEPEQTIAFYEKVFGWTFQKWEGADEPYWLITTGPTEQPGINGGLMRRHGAGPTQGQAVNGFVCIMDVPAIDEYVEKATTAGATIALPKMAVPTVGWLAYFHDPSGNIFGMMQMDPNAK